MNDKYCNTRDQPVYDRFPQTFSCRVTIANDGFFMKFMAQPKKMFLGSDSLSFEGLTMPWAQIQQVERKGARISVSTVDSKINIIILSPISGMQDPNLAMLIESLMIALNGGRNEIARALFKKLQIFSWLVKSSIVTCIALVVSVGLVTFFLPSFFMVYGVIAVSVAMTIVWFPTAYARRQER